MQFRPLMAPQPRIVSSTGKVSVVPSAPAFKDQHGHAGLRQPASGYRTSEPATNHNGIECHCFLPCRSTSAEADSIVAKVIFYRSRDQHDLPGQQPKSLLAPFLSSSVTRIASSWSI